MVRIYAVLFSGLLCMQLQAGIIDPDCTAEKAAKSAAMKATVGVSGRCSAKEAVADSLDVDDKKDAVSDAKDNVGDRVDDAPDHLQRKALKKAVGN
ncbi:hypothetical protein [Pseudomonas sp. BMS12]|uniref:hypothetical protein n=1 Tax=Pseudomonas sp. BMS12 TaxID=1796033 RepID=UPI000839E124|nr:hypothetical protein [Pseudomonas sp. BMS12]